MSTILQPTMIKHTSTDDSLAFWLCNLKNCGPCWIGLWWFFGGAAAQKNILHHPLIRSIPRPSAGRKADEKHMWLASEGQNSGGMSTNIKICNHVVACPNIKMVQGSLECCEHQLFCFSNIILCSTVGFNQFHGSFVSTPPGFFEQYCHCYRPSQG